MTTAATTARPERVHGAAGSLAWFGAAGLGLAATLAYLLTLSAQYSSDGMAFARLSRDGNLAAPLFFQAEHLLYPFVGWAFARIGAPLGLGDPLLALQVLNALGGGLAVAALSWSAFRLLPSAWAAGAVGLALGASYGWWYHSSDAEDQILANAGLLIAFAALAAARGPFLRGVLPTGRGWAVVLGMAAAMLIHATTVLFLPAALILFFRDATRREAVVLAALGALIVGLPYLAIGVGVHGLGDLSAWRGWLLAAPGQGVWGRISPRNLWAGLQSLTAAAIWLPSAPSAAGLRALAPGAIAAFVVVAAMAAGLVAATVAVLRSRDRLGVALLVWALTFAGFGAYWAPDDPQFWLLVLPPLYLLAARALPAWALYGVVVPLAIWNLAAGVLPRHNPANNAGLLAARCLADRLSPNDLVIAPGWDWAGDYLPYFSGVNVLSLNDAYVLTAQGDRATFFDAIERRIAATRSTGGRVYLVRLDSLTEDEAAFFRRVTGLGASDFAWRRIDAFTCGTEPVREVLP
ncbi:MAG: hypothetical protein U0556_15270 [Dehalococcoidia bacterium]